MAKYCTKCGKELIENQPCPCQNENRLTKLKKLLKIGTDIGDAINVFEKDKTIVPDCIKANDGEVPVKQYKLAKLRSRIRGHHADGKLLVTNKRVIFRAAGISNLGKTINQSEFSISDIAGVEIKKGNRISILNIFGAIILTLAVSAEFRSLFSKLYDSASVLSVLLSLVVFIGSIALLIFLKNKNWLKLIAFSCAIGALLGSSGLAISVWSALQMSSLNAFLILLACIGWFIALLKVCFVPDLVFLVKTNAAGDIIAVKRRVWGTFFKQPDENTGFSEVLPGADCDLATEELGALISDLQIYGDGAISKWGENND